MYFTCPRGLTWMDHGMGGHVLWPLVGLSSEGCGKEVREEEERGANLLTRLFSGNIALS